MDTDWIYSWLPLLVFVTVLFCVRRRRLREETRTRRRGGGTKEPSRCFMAFKYVYFHI